MWGLRMRIIQAHRSGNLYLGLSAASAVGAAGFYVLSENELRTRRRLEADFDSLLAVERVKARDESAANVERLKSAPVLWSGTVTNFDQRLQGHAMLRNSKIGSTVDVLEEQAGSHGRYLQVRNRGSGEVGLVLETWVKREAV